MRTGLLTLAGRWCLRLPAPHKPAKEFLLKPSLLNRWTRCVSSTPSVISDMKDLKSRDHLITYADEGRTLVCYHPERAFPYEHSLPVPRGEALLNEDESVLKVQFRQDWIDESEKKNKEKDFDQLARIFSQDKVGFLPRPREMRRTRHRKSPQERDGL